MPELDKGLRQSDWPQAVSWDRAGEWRRQATLMVRVVIKALHKLTAIRTLGDCQRAAS